MADKQAPTMGIVQGPAAPARDVCCVKIASNGNMPCGAPVKYINRAEADALGMRFTGWAHIEPIHDHHAVPKAWVR